MFSTNRSYDKPTSNVLPFTVIGLSLAMGLYAILALPGYGNAKPNLVASFKNIVQVEYSVSVKAPIGHKI